MNDGKLDGKQVLSPSLSNRMAQHHVPVPSEIDSFYAYGLTTFKFKGFEFVAHSGFSRGYGSMIQMVPSKKFAVIVLTNKSGETMRKSLNKATELGLGIKDDEPARVERSIFFSPNFMRRSEWRDIGHRLHRFSSTRMVMRKS